MSTETISPPLSPKDQSTSSNLIDHLGIVSQGTETVTNGTQYT